MSRVVSGVLMVAGTAIGAGIWAIPVITSHLGFPMAVVMLFMAWFIMWLSAKILQVVNSFMPPRANFIGMVSWSLGFWPTLIKKQSIWAKGGSKNNQN